MKRREFLMAAAAVGAATGLGLGGLRAAVGSTKAAAAQPAQPSQPLEPATRPAPKLARGVSQLPVIDAHIHFICDHPDVIRLMRGLNVRMVNITTAGQRGRRWRQQATSYHRLATSYPDRYAWITAFELPPLQMERDYYDKVFAEMDQGFRDGCVAVKVIKSIGMNLKDADGRFMQIDNPVFHPIFEHMQKQGYPLLAHIGEPLAAWLPLDPNNAHYHYYSKNARYHMYGKQGFPSHAEILAARDHVLELFPKLHVIGAHLGSMEYDLNVMADHLDRYPNLALDTSARMYDLTYHEGALVRAFINKYQDRLLFGLDIGWYQPEKMTADNVAEVEQMLRDAYQREYDYYGTTDMVKVNVRTVRGIGLSESVQRKLFHDNALAWYPRLA